MEIHPVVETGFLEANGTRFYYEVTGEGEPLLLIHGYNLDTRLWEDQVEAFARKYRVIRFDVRGFGQTPATEIPFTLYDDTRAVLQGLGVEKAHVAGLSFGGMVAAEFAIAYPEMVKSLILVSSGLMGHSRTEQRIRDTERFNQICQTGTREEALEMTIQMWFDGPGYPVNESAGNARERFRMMNEHAFSLPEFGKGIALLSPPVNERLEEIKVPTLVIAGDRDYPDFLHIADVLTERIEGAQKVIIEGSAHIPPMDQPDVFNRIVLEFLEQLN
jgi:3-oxoadipate enol-lactonase